MAHIQDRGKDVERRWQARYRAPDGAERTKTFRRKVDAQRWLDEVTTDLVTGRYVDPKAGKVTFGRFAERWLKAQTFDPSTREAVRNRLDNHILPTFKKAELRAIRPSMVQAWLRGRQQELAPRTVRTLLANLSGILGAAVEDGLIARNPCASSSVRAPSVPDKRIVPWTVEQVEAIAGAHPERYGATAVVCAGCGLRQGETFGLAVDAVDFLRHIVHVRQQVKLIAGKPIFAPPKGGKIREVPLPEWVAVALAEHIRRHPPIEVTLPWRGLDGPPRTSQLIFTSRESGPVNRNYFNPHIWKPSLKAVGLATTRDHGMHALRHHYASVLLDGGISIRALAEYLGHADPGFTLRIYSHLMPNTEDRARAVVDAAHDRREHSDHEAGGEG